MLIMAALPPCVADADIIFCSCGFYLLLFSLAYSQRSELRQYSWQFGSSIRPNDTVNVHFIAILYQHFQYDTSPIATPLLSCHEARSLKSGQKQSTEKLIISHSTLMFGKQKRFQQARDGSHVKGSPGS